MKTLCILWEDRVIDLVRVIRWQHEEPATPTL
jgi:hypothetical protein